MKIRMDVDGTRITATLDDNATAKDFASLLPLTLSLDDYNGTEKISDLPKKLTTRGAADGVEPAAGDIAYYAPWGNLAIFYKDFEYSRGLVKLGAIESGARAFERPGSLRVTITIGRSAIKVQPGLSAGSGVPARDQALVAKAAAFSNRSGFAR